MLRRRDSEIFLAFEVVEERALGDAGRRAKLIHRGGVIALFPNDPQSPVQQTVSRRLGLADRLVQFRHTTTHTDQSVSTSTHDAVIPLISAPFQRRLRKHLRPDMARILPIQSRRRPPHDVPSHRRSAPGCRPSRSEAPHTAVLDRPGFSSGGLADRHRRHRRRDRLVSDP